MSNVSQLRDGKHYALEAEIAARLKGLIMEYEGRISLVATVGILELIKADLLKEAA